MDTYLHPVACANRVSLTCQDWNELCALDELYDKRPAFWDAHEWDPHTQTWTAPDADSDDESDDESDDSTSSNAFGVFYDSDSDDD